MCSIGLLLLLFLALTSEAKASAVSSHKCACNSAEMFCVREIEWLKTSRVASGPTCKGGYYYVWGLFFCGVFVKKKLDEHIKHQNKRNPVIGYKFFLEITPQCAWVSYPHHRGFFVERAMSQEHDWPIQRCSPSLPITIPALDLQATRSNSNHA